MKKVFFVSLFTLLLFTIYFYLRHPPGEVATISGHRITLELAITEPQKEKGLGYRDSLPTDHGMLFVYQNRDRHGFWMKGMRFPLDYIWIDGNRIVDLSPDIPAPRSDTDRPVELAPNVPVDKILEVNAGVIQSLGVHVGDIVQFTN